MGFNKLTIVCYTGGTCGDLISNLIDSSDNIIKYNTDREKLKKPHLFNNNNEKDIYLNKIQYCSIPSHDLAYHIDRGHDFIGIRVQDPTIALWAATRFKQLHRPQVWEEMTNACGATTIELYAQMIMDFGNLISEHTDKIINLEDIVGGKALTKLQEFVKLDTKAEFIYQQWLQANI